MSEVRSLLAWMNKRGLDGPGVAQAASVDPKVIHALLDGHYTPSPEQRQRIAAALDLTPDQVSWTGEGGTEPMYGF